MIRSGPVSEKTEQLNRSSDEDILRSNMMHTNSNLINYKIFVGRAEKGKSLKIQICSVKKIDCVTHLNNSNISAPHHI